LCIFKNINEGLGSWIAEMAIWLASKIGDGIAATGELDLTREWFTGVFSSISGLAALIALIAVLLSVMAAALFRDPGEIVRTLLKVLTAGVSTGMVVIVVSKANQLIDAFCLYLLGPGGWKEVTDGLMAPATKLDDWIGLAAPLAPTTVMVLIAIGVILAFLILWVEMLVRRMLLDVCVLMWPLVVSGAVWSGARPMTRRLIDTIISLEIMKLGGVAIFKAAGKMLQSIDSVDEMMLALVLYWVAAASPWMVMRLVGIVGGLNPGGTGEGMRAVAAGAAGALLARGRRVASVASRGLGSAGAMRPGGRTPMPAIGGAGASASGGDGGEGSQSEGERDYSKIRPIPGHLLRAFGIQPASGGNAGADSGAGTGAAAGDKQAGRNGKGRTSPTNPSIDGTASPSPRPQGGGASPGSAGRAPASPSAPTTPASTAASGARPATGSPPGTPTPPTPAPPAAPTVRGTSWGRQPPQLPPPFPPDALPTYDNVPPPPPVPLPPLAQQPELPDLDPPPEPS
ncbi:MAG TPA: hypothetical protein VGE95_19190, partial [Arthrobacter sp.]